MGLDIGSTAKRKRRNEIGWMLRHHRLPRLHYNEILINSAIMWIPEDRCLMDNNWSSFDLKLRAGYWYLFSSAEATTT